MSGWIGAFAGGLMGGGAALQTKARDEAEHERRLEWEQMREKAAMDRQERLLALQQQYRREERDYETSPEMTEKAAARQRALAQAGLDVANNPDNVQAEANRQGVIARATPRMMSPGQQEVDGEGRVIRENKRETSAEATARLYSEGLKGQEKLPPAYVSTITRIEKERADLDKSIRSMEEKMATDPMLIGDPSKKDGKPSAAEMQLNAWRQKRAMLGVEAERAAIENGLIDPVKRANDMVAAASSLDELNTMITQAKRAGGSDWARQLGDVISKNGMMRRFDKGPVESQPDQPSPSGGASVRPPMNETPAESDRLRREPASVTDQFRDGIKNIDTKEFSILGPKGKEIINDVSSAVGSVVDDSAETRQSRLSSGGIVANQSRNAQTQARLEAIKAITPQAASSMSPEDARIALDAFRNLLAPSVVRILEQRAR
jgi:hypothetical protein